ncbi:MAG: isocitrate/isopropylmalate family dehydrogenase [Anaerolineae bacterium]
MAARADIAGQGIADPRAAILSAALLLEYLNYREQAALLRRVTYATPHAGSTQATTGAILRELETERHRV